MPPSFLALPLEVRNEIYSHVFNYDFIMPHCMNSGNRLFVHGPRNCSDGFFDFEMSDPEAFLALLEVNHEISDEAAAYFYGNMRFCGRWRQIAAFVTGVGARRRDMIRSVELKHPSMDSPLTNFHFSKGRTLELLSGLASLRTVRITTFEPSFTQIQKELIQAGIFEVAGKFDITVHHTSNGTELGYSASHAGTHSRAEYIWTFPKDSSRGTGGTLNRTLLPDFP